MGKLEIEAQLKSPAKFIQVLQFVWEVDSKGEKATIILTKEVMLVT